MPRAAFCSGAASCGRTKATLRDLGRTALSTFREASLLLDLSHADTSRLDGVRYIPREVAEAALAHVVGNKVEAAYARSDLFERRRQLMNDWAAYVGGGP